MRRRLLIVLTVFAAIAVLAFAVPLSLTAATSRTQQLVLGRSGDADRFATLADGAGSAGGVQALADEVGRYHELYGENVLVVDARGTPIVNAGVDESDPRIMAAVAAARRNQRPQHVDRLTPWSDQTMLIARPVGTGVQVNGAVVIEASTTAARVAIAQVWAVIGFGAVGAMVVFILLALVLSRWVLRPLAAMSDAVAELTATLPKPGPAAPREPSGDPSTALITRRYGGPPEVRALAESVDAMAAAVADSADAQRQLVADTAHAMRNPLAALTIRLDSLEAAIPERASATFRGASAEVDRLTALLDALLELAVAEAPAAFGAAAFADDYCDAIQVVADRIDAWTPAFAEAGIQLTTGVPVGGAESTYTDRADWGSAKPRASNEAAHRGAAVEHVQVSGATNGPRGSGAENSPATDVAEREIAAAARGERSTETAINSAALAQILDVALSNSCRYAGSGAHTVVDVLIEPGWVIVRVADDGRGVEAGELDKLTSRFFRGATAAAGGTGLGLSIAQALTKARGGTLTVESVQPHGLAVAIRLPAVSR
ncbi:sensor histidine kinase [Nocardia sp. NPDC059180]|uniref:sensor histidine kinase n=1 Tax=Nocardia sp. NPDC059180 TaxID=3346761 RepID=UPI0036B121D1